MLNIAVCVKAVPDPGLAEKLKIDPVTKLLPRLDIPLVINPLDRHALEAALQLKNKYQAHITVFSMGPPAAGNIVRECLALGADKGVLLTDPAFAGADALATAFTLAKAIEKNGLVDVVFCGMSSSDGATEWVGPEIAVFLNFPVVTMVKEIFDDHNNEWIVKADYEHGYRLVKLKLPAVITVTRELNHPKPLSFSGVLKSRNKEISVWELGQIELPAERVGLMGSPTKVTEMTCLENRRNVKIIEGTLQEKVERLVQILFEAGVIR